VRGGDGVGSMCVTADGCCMVTARDARAEAGAV
jgi:hypothetical protein